MWNIRSRTPEAHSRCGRSNLRTSATLHKNPHGLVVLDGHGNDEEDDGDDSDVDGNVVCRLPL